MTGNWDYSNLSSMAKTAGGPQALIEGTYNSGFAAGRLSTIPGGIMACLISMAVGYAIRFLTERFIISPLRDLYLEADDIIAIDDAVTEADENELSELKCRYDNLIRRSEDNKTEEYEKETSYDF